MFLSKCTDLGISCSCPITIRKRKRLSPLFVAKLFGAVLLIAVGWYLKRTWYVPALSWTRYSFQQKGWIWGCGMRKEPWIQVLGTRSVVVSWETGCAVEEGLEFSWSTVPLRSDEAGLSRKLVTTRTGARYEIKANHEHVLGRSEMEYVKISQRHHVYRVRLTDLPAEHLVEYYVKIANGDEIFSGYFPVIPDNTSPTGSSSPPALSHLEIAVVGDNQNGQAAFQRICKRIEARNPHLFIHVGDAVQSSRFLHHWQTQLFDQLGWYSGLSAKCPLVMVQGNHDVTGSAKIPGHYFVPASEEGHFYGAFSYGPIRMIVLDSNEETDAQVAWLEAELSRPSTQKAPYKLILCHIPPFIEFWDPAKWAAGEKSWPLYVRTRLLPLFEKYRVDLVISGHQHNYQRGVHKGINYLISGGGGGELDGQRVEDYKAFSKTIIRHHYLIMSVTGNGISVHAYSEDDRILDTFYIPRSIARKMKPSEMLPQ